MKEDSTDGPLLAAARKGDREAFLLLFKRYREPIFRFLYRFLGSEIAAEDITHDCFLDLVKNPECSASNEVSVLIELYGRARELAIAYEKNHLQDKLQRAGIEEATVDMVKQSINDLPRPERETLILFEYESLSINEIATIVENNDEAVRRRLDRARQKLRAALSAKQSSRADP